MKIIIQCAGRKQEGGYWLNEKGQPVLFVAHPEWAHPTFDGILAAPDSKSPTGPSWRDLALAYNKNQPRNPHRLYKAYQLYRNPAYQALADKLGCQNVFILSAGWGLIRSDFLTPNYDITFKGNAKTAYLWRRPKDRFDDFNMLPVNTRDPIVYLGGKDYIPLFCSLTQNLACPKTIIHNSSGTVRRDGYRMFRYPTKTRTNWHYACANEILSGSFSVDV
jgi:hypothetical protein